VDRTLKKFSLLVWEIPKIKKKINNLERRIKKLEEKLREKEWRKEEYV